MAMAVGGCSAPPNGFSSQISKQPLQSAGVTTYVQRDTSVTVANAAITKETRPEINQTIDAMYERIPKKEIDRLGHESYSSLLNKISDIRDDYSVGDSLSSSDQTRVLYLYKKYGSGKGDVSKDTAQTVAYLKKTHSISNSSTKSGVHIGYSGVLTTYSTLMTGRYGTTVGVSKYSGKTSSAKWTTYGKAYGVIGSSGKIPSIGVVYSGSTSSSRYKKSFSFDRTVKFSAVATVAVVTWGALKVKTPNSNFTLNTRVYTDPE